MNKQNLWVGIFITAAIALFGAGLFLIGNQHKAFSDRSTFYTEFANVEGIAKGAKVRVGGLDAGQLTDIQIPSTPSHDFRLKMQVDDRLRGLIRDDSLVTIETQGIVGDEFILIHTGSDRAPEAQKGATLHSKEPFQIAKLLEQATGIMQQVSGTVTQVNGTLVDVQHRLDGSLDAVTRTVNNANGLVADVRGGKGAAGVLLADPQTAQDVRQVVTNARDATGQLQSASVQVNQLLNEVQKRQLIAKVDTTLNQTQSATAQLDQASRQVNTTLQGAFAQDQYGENAGSNLQQTLSNVNVATGNLADDTEALKHEFFFKGFFKKRGYDSLNNLPVTQYRSGELFKKTRQDRQWIAADPLFMTDGSGAEALSPMGRVEIDQAVSRMPDLYSEPVLVEGYAAAGTPDEQLTRSRRRATLVRSYLQLHYHVEPKNTGVVALSSTPPTDAGKANWDGVALVGLTPPK